MDLVQLRWLQIRSIETQQTTEKENVVLRQTIKDLTVANKELMRKLEVVRQEVGAWVSTWSHHSRRELDQVKILCENELQAIRRSFHLLSETVDKFKTHSNVGNEVSKQEITELRAEIIRLEKELSEVEKSKTQESEKQRSKLAKLREDLDQANHARSLLITDYSLLKDKFEAMESSRFTLESKAENSQAECKRLRAIINSLEATEASNRCSTQEAIERLTEYYESLLKKLHDENKTLLDVISSQKEEIEKLNNALMGNKNHFAKYVELKQENITLATKLKQLEKDRIIYSALEGGYVTADRVSSVPQQQPIPPMGTQSAGAARPTAAANIAARNQTKEQRSRASGNSYNQGNTNRKLRIGTNAEGNVRTDGGDSGVIGSPRAADPSISPDARKIRQDLEERLRRNSLAAAVSAAAPPSYGDVFSKEAAANLLLAQLEEKQAAGAGFVAQHLPRRNDVDGATFHGDHMLLSGLYDDEDSPRPVADAEYRRFLYENCGGDDLEMVKDTGVGGLTRVDSTDEDFQVQLVPPPATGITVAINQKAVEPKTANGPVVVNSRLKGSSLKKPGNSRSSNSGSNEKVGISGNVVFPPLVGGNTGEKSSLKPSVRTDEKLRFENIFD